MRQNRRPQCRRYKVCRSHQTGNASCRMLSANPLDRGALLPLYRLHHPLLVRSPQSPVLSRSRQLGISRRRR